MGAFPSTVAEAPELASQFRTFGLSQNASEAFMTSEAPVAPDAPMIAAILKWLLRDEDRKVNLDEESLQRLHNEAVEALYSDLPHPPSYMMAPRTNLHQGVSPRNYVHRSADGSNNDPHHPTLGMAGQPYARTVPPLNLDPPFKRPDAGRVFDLLLRKPDTAPGSFEAHPYGLSALFFAFADLVIHSIFRTDPQNNMINASSSYLDLSPLYGSNEEQVNRIRRKDGTGRLHEDVFNDPRVLFRPPAICVLLVLLSRNHNYIAEKLLAVNEQNNYRDLSDPELNLVQRMDQDERLFQQARLINTGFFSQIALRDYVGALLNLTTTRSTWRLDPLSAMNSSQNRRTPVPRAQGGAMSIEFNLMYRWHSTISEKDTEWNQKFFNRLFEGQTPDQVEPERFRQVMREQMIRITAQQPTQWTFDGLKRDEQGRFDDGALARILLDSTEDIAGAFRARGIPAVLRVAEILGIEQGRAWGTCSMNEFRKFMGLAPFTSFKEWNQENDIHTAAAALYKHIDNLELYVGLLAEGVNPQRRGFAVDSINRPVFSDAVNLTRSDRFLTTEFTPFNFTTWGFQDCILSKADKEDGSFGGILTKLLFRTLPDYYPVGSAYAHFPFFVPVNLRERWKKFESNPESQFAKLVHKYSWDRPAPPLLPVTVNVEREEWKSDFEDRLVRVVGVETDTSLVQKALEAIDWRGWFADETKKLIAEMSSEIPHPGKSIDIVKDVLNMLPVRWVSFILDHVATGNTELQLKRDFYDDLAVATEYLLFNFEPKHDWILRERSITFFNQVLNSMPQIPYGDFLNSLIQSTAQFKDIDSKVFWEEGSDWKKLLAANIFAFVVPSAAQYSQVLSLVVDYYAGDEEKKAEIVALAEQDTEQAYQVFIKLVCEALAANRPVYSVMRTSTADVEVDGKLVQAGQRVFVNLPTCPIQDGQLFPGLSTDGLLSSRLFAQTAPRTLKAIFELKGLEKVRKMEKFVQKWRDGKEMRYVNDIGRSSPFPTSLVVRYD